LNLLLFKFAGKNQSCVALQGLGLIIPAFVMIAFATNLLLVYLGLVLYSTGSGMVVPCLTTIASNHGRDDQKGTVMGIFRSLGAVARAIGPLFSSILYWSFGPTVCYCIGGLMLILPLSVLRKR
jgi:predicted MFS family arabinose efflux permease